MKFMSKYEIHELLSNNEWIAEGYNAFKKQMKNRWALVDLYCRCHFWQGSVTVYVEYYLYSTQEIKTFEYELD